MLSPAHFHDAAWKSRRLLEEPKPHNLLRGYSTSAVDPSCFASGCSCTMSAHYEPKWNAQQEPAVTELDPSMEEQVWALFKMWNWKTLRHIIGQKAGPGPSRLSKVNQYAIKERNAAQYKKVWTAKHTLSNGLKLKCFFLLAKQTQHKAFIWTEAYDKYPRCNKHFPYASSQANKRGSENLYSWIKH